MRVLDVFNFYEHSEALDRGEAQLWFGTHLPVPQKEWRYIFFKYHRRQKFLVTIMQGDIEKLVKDLPKGAICVLEDGETLPRVKRAGNCFALKTPFGYMHALDMQGEVWPSNAINALYSAVAAV